MSRCRRGLLWCALAGFAGACLPACASATPTASGSGSGSGGARRVILATYAANPQDVLAYPADGHGAPHDALLDELAAQPGLSVGLWSSIQGTYAAQQALLDVSQGTRQSTSLYGGVDVDHNGRIDDLRLDRVTRTYANWPAFRARARDVSLTIQPGLLAGSIPGGAGFVGVAGASTLPAIAAADVHGRVAAISLGAVRTLAARARALSRSRRLVVVSLPQGAAGLAQLTALARARSADDLLLVVQLPDTPALHRFGIPPARLLREPAFAIGAGGHGSPTSGTTRQHGLVSSIDLAPTALQWLGLTTPDPMRGQPVKDGPRVSPARLDELRLRWTQIRDGRQAASFLAIAMLAAIVFLLLGTWRDIRTAVRPALRIGALGVLWWPSAVLLAAVVEPSAKVAETFLIAGSSLVLAVVTERLLPWRRAPIAPAAVCLLAYTVVLAIGNELFTRSVLGPSIASGGRFYGVSNELEPILPIVALVGLAAVAGGRAVTRATMALYAGTGLALLVMMGWGRLGADVGGAITVGAGVAVATLVMAPGALTARRVGIAALVPVGALALLIVIDLALSGGSHLTRNLLRADNASELLELVTRRYQLAYRALTTGNRPALFLAAALAVAFAWRNRARLYGGLPHRAWAAALFGGLAAGIAGALANDSGPVLFINAVFGLVALTAYLLGRPVGDAFAPGRRST